MTIYNINDVLSEAWECGKTIYFDRFYNPYIEEELLGNQPEIVDKLDTSKCDNVLDVLKWYIDRAEIMLDKKCPVIYDPLASL